MPSLDEYANQFRQTALSWEAYREECHQIAVCVYRDVCRQFLAKVNAAGVKPTTYTTRYLKSREVPAGLFGLGRRTESYYATEDCVGYRLDHPVLGLDGRFYSVTSSDEVDWRFHEIKDYCGGYVLNGYGDARLGKALIKFDSPEQLRNKLEQAVLSYFGGLLARWVPSPDAD